MGAESTPRQKVKAILRGEAPPTPLLIPLLFALGTRLENLLFQNFKTNPTKISDALRQIRSVLKVDGVTCYYDPFLEAEALGCRCDRREDGSCILTPPSFTITAELRDRLKSSDVLSREGAVPVACEVIRRVKSMLRDEPALMVRVTGPLTLAQQLVGESNLEDARLPGRELIKFAAETTASVCKSFVEAGSDLVLLTEDAVPALNAEASQWYCSLLAPINNAIRFYEALPVLLLSRISDATLAVLLDEGPECLLCPPLSSDVFACAPGGHSTRLMGVNVPAEAFASASHHLHAAMTSLGDLRERPCLITSATDIAIGTDMKTLTANLSAIRGYLGK